MLFLAVFFLAGLWVGRITRSGKDKKNSENKIYRQAGDYQFISPLLDCNYYEGSLGPVKGGRLKQKLESFSDQASVYFRDLNNGSMLEINGEEKFTPASLLKVPIMIAFFKMAESKPGFLAEKVVYKSSPEAELAEENFKPEVILQEGVEYTLEEVIKNMIVYSNNLSAHFLSNLLDRQFFNETFSDLGIAIPGKDNQTENYMTVREYASFFRILYNSSYLGREMSEKALSILSQSKFTAGLVAGLPEGVKTAHKFGERTFGETKQLHDCGIIYHPKYPYLLCVMTRGRNNEILSQTIKDISKIVYEEVSK